MKKMKLSLCVRLVYILFIGFMSKLYLRIAGFRSSQWNLSKTATAAKIITYLIKQTSLAFSFREKPFISPYSLLQVSRATRSFLSLLKLVILLTILRKCQWRCASSVQVGVEIFKINKHSGVALCSKSCASFCWVLSQWRLAKDLILLYRRFRRENHHIDIWQHKQNFFPSWETQ